VFDEMRRGDFEGARDKASNLDEMIDDVAEPGQADLGERAENLASFAEHALDRYSWGFNPQETLRLNRLIEETREAIKKGNKAVLERKVAELDEATEKLPDVVSVLLRIQMLIHGRIQPVDPATAGRLMQEIGEIERAFKTDDPQQEKKFAAYMEKVANALKAAEGAQPKARKCSVCGSAVPAGERFCPKGHDTWTLKDKSAGAASF
jgi:methionyl-tRNA synthetase